MFSVAGLLSGRPRRPSGKVTKVEIAQRSQASKLREGCAWARGTVSRMANPDRRSVNLSEKLAQFDEHWSPRTVTTFNGHDIMVVKVKGDFVWHSHADTDDFFMVLKGRLTIRLRDGDVELGAGELFVVPVGVEHQPFAAEEAELLLIEPSGTPNTGDAATAARRVVI
jgi:mannose-6-phosphate isomerase-like protein (cupin superfamily)